MAQNIIVPLRRRDRVEEFIPCIEEVSEAGARVVFFCPYPVEPWLHAHWATAEFPPEAAAAGRKIMERYSWQSQKGLAEQRVFSASAALREQGVEVAVELYRGPLITAMESYAGDGNCLVLMRAGMTRLLYRVVSFFRRLKGGPILPALLLQSRYRYELPLLVWTAFDLR